MGSRDSSKALPSWRTDKRKTAERGYGGKWQRAREFFLQRNPLCVFCQKRGRPELATVVDHIIPHKGDLKLFWDRKNWQPLCKSCHDGEKQALERGREIQQIGLDGWPI